MKNIILIAFLGLIGFTINGQSVTEVSQDWTSFSQFLEIKSDTQKKFKVVASVKVETDDEGAWAGVWARVDNDNDEQGFFDNMGDRPIKSNTWQSYTVEGTIGKNSSRLNFGGVCISNGKFYFDNFQLFIENNAGVFESVKVDNASFESIVNSDVIPKWSQGVSKEKIVKVKANNVVDLK